MTKSNTKTNKTKKRAHRAVRAKKDKIYTSKDADVPVGALSTLGYTSPYGEKIPENQIKGDTAGEKPAFFPLSASNIVIKFDGPILGFKDAVDATNKPRHTYNQWHAIKNPPPPRINWDELFNGLVTEEEYLARVAKEKEEADKMAAESKRREELRQPPYYHFKEEFPEMGWQFKQLEFGERECVGVTYDGVEFCAPYITCGWVGGYAAISPKIDVDIIQWSNERVLLSDEVIGYGGLVSLGAPTVTYRSQMDSALKWVREEYPKIVEAYNTWYNKWYRRLWRWVSLNTVTSPCDNGPI